MKDKEKDQKIKKKKGVGSIIVRRGRDLNPGGLAPTDLAGLRRTRLGHLGFISNAVSSYLNLSQSVAHLRTIKIMSSYHNRENDHS